jgi:hypothetical protein
VTVIDSAVSGGQTFAACADGDDAEGVDALRVPLARGRGLAQASGASGALTTSLCKSIYTVKISAKIPEPTLVDPSDVAHYNVDHNPDRAGYNHSTGSLNALIHNSALRGILDLAHEYPDCFSTQTVERYSEDKVHAQWYSFIRAGGSIGSVSVPLQWNQETQQVHVAQAPEVRNEKLTRVVRYKLHIDGRTKTGSCEETNTVPLVVLPVGGGDKPGAMDSNQFTIVAAWGLPFVARGVRIAPESTYVSKALNALGHVGREVYERYESLPELAKFGLDFGVSYLIGTAEVKAVEGAGSAVRALLGSGAKYFPGVVKGTEDAAWLAEELHHLKTAQEILGFISGAVGSGDYPIMSTVVRGTLRVAKYLPFKLNGKSITAQTSLAVSARSTRFPDISVKITRDAYPATASSGSSSGKVFTGALPWSSNVFGDPVATENPSLDRFGAYLVADATKTGHYYASGKPAVHAVQSDTDQLPAVENAMHEGTLAQNFKAEQAERPAPPAATTTAPPATTPSAGCSKTNGLKHHQHHASSATGPT